MSLSGPSWCSLAIVVPLPRGHLRIRVCVPQHTLGVRDSRTPLRFNTSALVIQDYKIIASCDTLVPTALAHAMLTGLPRTVVMIDVAVLLQASLSDPAAVRATIVAHHYRHCYSG